MSTVGVTSGTSGKVVAVIARVGIRVGVNSGVGAAIGEAHPEIKTTNNRKYIQENLVDILAPSCRTFLAPKILFKNLIYIQNAKKAPLIPIRRL